MISRRLRLGAAVALLCSATSSFALNTATIISSTLSPDCLEYRVTGICYWLYCTWTAAPCARRSRYATTFPTRWYRATATPGRILGRGAGNEPAQCHGAGRW